MYTLIHTYVHTLTHTYTYTTATGEKCVAGLRIPVRITKPVVKGVFSLQDTPVTGTGLGTFLGMFRCVYIYVRVTLIFFRLQL
jgi:hypothetical protein